MKDLTNHHLGHGEPLRHADESDPGCEDYGMEAADALSKFGCLGTCIMILVLLLAGMCSSCSHKSVTIREEVPVFVHDTLERVSVRIDSFLQRDSIYYETLIKGDTITRTKYIEKWRTKVELKHDTAVQVVEVPVTYTECTQIEVPAKLTLWQQIKLRFGAFGIGAALAFFAHLIITHTRARFGFTWLINLFKK